MPFMDRFFKPLSKIPHFKIYHKIMNYTTEKNIIILIISAILINNLCNFFFFLGNYYGIIFTTYPIFFFTFLSQCT